MKRQEELTQFAGFSVATGFACVLCGRTPGNKGGYIPKPLDRRPPGVRCGWCYRRYLRKYFPEAIEDQRGRPVR
jgi:hypothetical protein